MRERDGEQGRETGDQVTTLRAPSTSSAEQMASAILQARVDRVYQRALHAHALLGEKRAGHETELAPKPADIDAERRGPMA